MEDRRIAEFKEWNRDRFIEFKGDAIELPIVVSESDIQKLINRLEKKPVEYLMPFSLLAKERGAKGYLNVNYAKNDEDVFVDATMTLKKKSSFDEEETTIVKDIPIFDEEYIRLLDVGNDFCKEIYNKSLDEKLEELDHDKVYGFAGFDEQGKYYFVEDGTPYDESIIPKEEQKQFADIEELTEMVMNSKSLNWIPYETKDCVKELMGIYLEDKIDDPMHSQSIPISMGEEFVDMMEFNYNRWNNKLMTVISYENGDEYIINMCEGEPRLYSMQGNIKEVKGRKL